jgi:DNA-binding response OmpR family regulator
VRSGKKHVNPKGYVVVFEDDALIGSLLDQWLTRAGYRVARPGDVSETAPMLVIADVPDPRAAETVLGPLREYAAPILVLSARFRRGLAGSAEAARRLGVTKVLPKPFTRTELLDAVRASLKA